MVNIEKLDTELTQHLESLTREDLLQWIGDKRMRELLGEINRLEVINHNSDKFEIGRVLVYKGAVEVSLQVDNKTLKVFI
jgi:hypothetical protein